MASFETVGPSDDVLLVTGDDIHASGYRGKLRDYLYDGDTGAPVGEGTHDFWVTYAIPSLGGGEWAHQDLSKSPRKMRGIVRMPIPGDDSPSTLDGHLHVLFQEVGHHWLVPAGLELDEGGVRTPFPSGKEITRRINDDDAFPGPPLLARGDSHWSAYFQADASPMDGQHWEDRGAVDGYREWRETSFPGMTLSPGSLPALQTAGYCDLDRYIMGVMDASEAYSDRSGQFRWLEPKLSASHPYHLGLCLAFAPDDYFYFGFREDHRKLAVQRTGGPVVGEVEIGPDYDPLGHELNAMALRVVRRGDQYHFQARRGNPLAGCLAAVLKAVGLHEGRVPDMFEDLGSLPSPADDPDFSRFETVATLSAEEEPEAMGMIVKKWNHPHLAEGAFLNLEVRSGSSRRTLSTSSVPPSTSAGALSSLPTDELRIVDPTGDGIVRSRDGRLHLGAPFSVVRGGELDHLGDRHFDHWSDADGAVRALASAPSGDFAFASWAKVHRTIFTPWAAGYANGRTMWGRERSARVDDVVVPSAIQSRQTPPPGDTYKVAFIMVANQRSSVSSQQIETVDRIRRYFDEGFEETTLNRRHSDSTL